MLTQITRPSKRKNIPLSIPEVFFREEAVELRNRLLRYRMDYFYQINPDIEVKGLDFFDARLREVTTPLFQAAMMEVAPNDILAYFNRINDQKLCALQNSPDGMIAKVIFAQYQLGHKVLFPGKIANEMGSQNLDVTAKHVANFLRSNRLTPTKRVSEGWLYTIDEEAMTSISDKFGLN